MTSCIRTAALATTVMTFLIGAPCHAQSQATNDQSLAEEPRAEDIVVTGSRFGSRSVADSATPVDVIGAEELTRGGRSEMQEMLKASVPSFNTPRPSASGVGDFTTPPTLRGLSTGQLLLLVNGKRRHSSGDLSTSNGIGRGDVAYDFNAIPAAALSSVEVLRDGASAQYGSDAIAGVINLQLDKSLGFSGKATGGITLQGDGKYADVAAGYGAAIGNGGFLRVTVQRQDHNGTNRAVSDTRQQYFGRNAVGAFVLPSAFYGSGVGITAPNGTLDPREATIDRNTSYQGASPYHMTSAFVNSELPLGKVTAYAFGGFSDLKGQTPFFFRRAGQDQTVRSIHLDGFIPYGEYRLKNASAFGGLRGDLGGVDFDLSTGFGRSLINNAVSNSNNTSLGDASQTDFFTGGSRFLQWTTNLDLTHELDVGDGAPLKLALGGEYRKERYELVAGEPASYANGGVPVLDGPNAGRPAPVGSQPNPGVSPGDAAVGRRNAKSLYAEIEKEFFSRLTLDGAIRHEDFSDFGKTTNYKLSSRLEIVKPLALRASLSTGFRAPHLAQSFFNSSNTFFLNGLPVVTRNFPVQSLGGQLIGATPLRPEKSRNLSVGAVFQSKGWTATIDAYQIRLRDRIVQSSIFQDGRVTNLLATNGIPGIGAASYITNAVDSRTRGLDVTVNGHFDLGTLGRVRLLVAGNYNRTKLTRVAGTPPALAALGIATPLFDLTQQVRLTDSQPRSKILGNLNWTRGPLGVSLTNTLYGSVSTVAFTSLTPVQIAALTPGYEVTLVPVSATSVNSQVIHRFEPRLITDLQISYDLSQALQLSAGINNLFNRYPSENIRSTAAGVAVGSNGSDNAGTFRYNAISPFGFNGMSFFTSISVRL